MFDNSLLFLATMNETIYEYSIKIINSFKTSASSLMNSIIRHEGRISLRVTYTIFHNLSFENVKYAQARTFNPQVEIGSFRLAIETATNTCSR